MSVPVEAPVRVAFLSAILAEYKVHLHRQLARLPGYEVRLWHGPQRRGGTPADVDAGIEFPHRSARNLHLELGVPLVWQRVGQEVWNYRPDLLVLEDGVRILSNVLLLAQARARSVPVIFYSYGENLQMGLNRDERLGRLVEKARGVLHRQARSLVVYTEGTARALRQRHPDRRFHVATNTLDTEAIRGQLAVLPASHRDALRERLGISKEGLLVASVGRLVREHDPRPAIDAIRSARELGVDCQLLLVGSGPLEGVVRAHLLTLDEPARAAIHWLPGQSIAETTALLHACDVYLSPGTIGLAITHAFAAGLPFIAAESKFHSPEKDHLRHEDNGLLLRDLRQALVEALVRLSREPEERHRLARGAARHASEHLSAAAQVEGFRRAFDEAMAG